MSNIIMTSNKLSGKITPSLPYYAEPPNVLLRYEERQKVCGAGHRYIERVAIYLNKKKEQCEATAQIIWQDVI